MAYIADTSAVNIQWNNIHITNTVVVTSYNKYVNTTSNNVVLNVFRLDKGEVFAISNTGGGTITLAGDAFVVNNNATSTYTLDEQGVTMAFSKTDQDGAFLPTDSGHNTTPHNQWHTRIVTLTAQQVADRQIILIETPLDPNLVMMDIPNAGNAVNGIDFFVNGQILQWYGTDLDTYFTAGDVFSIRFIKT